ncbi:hypothetical protein JQ557_21120 [Bradyrhizobium sp. U87765 SZCCT0131]|nr:hypothetical protein [Bradyrhizobium sp. U87765 SZCCT0131]MBR1263029.1 hypothetical protein [Bradyrhizobium sp. U87765 SZCCT0134]MBR1307088.1 hypothetical protein [Bradyrhizobium sp. U87765 SZCCT0110]MBR1323024.1 hypothetical protein [Bradyrhizobium sp. U87765 SZCCT0109]MBR1346042.1 hypothetical protein [Bradyrhizobium sp. U87765 SZCCT0048]
MALFTATGLGSLLWLRHVWLRHGGIGRTRRLALGPLGLLPRPLLGRRTADRCIRAKIAGILTTALAAAAWLRRGRAVGDQIAGERLGHVRAGGVVLAEEAGQRRRRDGPQQASRTLVTRRTAAAEELRRRLAGIEVLRPSGGCNKAADQTGRRQTERSAQHSILRCGNGSLRETGLADYPANGSTSIDTPTTPSGSNGLVPRALVIADPHA